MTGGPLVFHFDLAGDMGWTFPDPARPPEAACGRTDGATTPYQERVTCPDCLDYLERWDDEGCDEEPDVDDEPPPDYGPPGSGAIITEYP